MEIPKVLTLHCNCGHHAGFMLLAPKEGQDTGDCVFMLSPMSVEGIDSDLGIVVAELKVAGEHPFSCIRAGNGIELTVSPEGLPPVRFELDSAFHGEVFTEFDQGITCIGTAAPVKKEGT